MREGPSGLALLRSAWLRIRAPLGGTTKGGVMCEQHCTGVLYQDTALLRGSAGQGGVSQ
jgi:hypothetical protein